MNTIRNNQGDCKSTQLQPMEYVVIGAGPAAICAVVKIYGSGVPGDKILWIDPKFKVGDFGTILSVGSSVPGNTSVESYQRVNNAIYAMVPSCLPCPEEKEKFNMTSLLSTTTCSLKVAAQPLQNITDNLLKLVYSIRGTVSDIRERKEGIELDVKSNNGTCQKIKAKRIILAVGAEPKKLDLKNEIIAINPNITFIESELQQYLKENPNIKTVAVIGSSHSAALAVMHLLKSGIMVRQFMNKDYKFATPAVASNGTRYTQFDNTGLKGEVAIFIRKLLQDVKAGQGEYAVRYKGYIKKDIDALLNTHLSGCTHAVVAIGYAPSNSLQINGLSILKFKYDKTTTQIIDTNGQPVSGVFGIGVAFPLEVKAISGEVEFAVGVEKFWTSFNDMILNIWKSYPAKDFMCSPIPISQNVTHTLHYNGLFQNGSGKEQNNSAKNSFHLRSKL